MSTSMKCQLCIRDCTEYGSLYENGSEPSKLFNIVVNYFHPMFLQIRPGCDDAVVCRQCWNVIYHFRKFQNFITTCQKRLMDCVQEVQSTDVNKKPNKRKTNIIITRSKTKRKSEANNKIANDGIVSPDLREKDKCTDKSSSSQPASSCNKNGTHSESKVDRNEASKSDTNSPNDQSRSDPICNQINKNFNTLQEHSNSSQPASSCNKNGTHSESQVDRYEASKSDANNPCDKSSKDPIYNQINTNSNIVQNHNASNRTSRSSLAINDNIKRSRTSQKTTSKRTASRIKLVENKVLGCRNSNDMNNGISDRIMPHMNSNNTSTNTSSNVPDRNITTHVSTNRSCTNDSSKNITNTLTDNNNMEIEIKSEPSDVEMEFTTEYPIHSNSNAIRNDNTKKSLVKIRDIKEMV
ncbi:uncharacterized protein [Musca autumnalis]|uniref:uncharacterized protein n=1 Tax=Musca autumnalis TaxID=221902 RepID=UPI003CE759DC